MTTAPLSSEELPDESDKKAHPPLSDDAASAWLSSHYGVASTNRVTLDMVKIRVELERELKKHEDDLMKLENRLKTREQLLGGATAAAGTHRVPPPRDAKRFYGEALQDSDYPLSFTSVSSPAFSLCPNLVSDMRQRIFREILQPYLLVTRHNYAAAATPMDENRRRYKPLSSRRGSGSKANDDDVESNADISSDGGLGDDDTGSRKFGCTRPAGGAKESKPAAATHEVLSPPPSSSPVAGAVVTKNPSPPTATTPAAATDGAPESVLRRSRRSAVVVRRSLPHGSRQFEDDGDDGEDLQQQPGDLTAEQLPVQSSPFERSSIHPSAKRRAATTARRRRRRMSPPPVEEELAGDHGVRNSALKRRRTSATVTAIRKGGRSSNSDPNNRLLRSASSNLAEEVAGASPKRTTRSSVHKGS